jgi:amidophosphoribosyltransferase
MCVASETCAFDLIHAEFIREVEPGEVLIISEDGIRSEWPFKEEKPAFLYVRVRLFRAARQHHWRRECGQGPDRNGARSWPGNFRSKPISSCRCRIPVTTPRSAFAHELNIPYEHAFVRNHYIGRTFLQPSQLIRDFDVRVKLNLIKEAVEGKRVVVIDDSIVRGTTARARVVNLREAGAKEVHMRVSCPPHRFACHYGIDFPDPEKLIANQKTMPEICDYLGVDSLGLSRSGGNDRGDWQSLRIAFCLACFTGKYPLASRSRAGQVHHGKARESGQSAGPKKRSLRCSPG